MHTRKVLMYLDKSIGRLVDYLESEGWMDNSIIVVASDNGGCPNSGGSNFPLRGTKASYWEGGTKVTIAAPVRGSCGCSGGEKIRSFRMCADTNILECGE